MPFETVYLFASGDLRESANKVCWPAQQAMEAQLTGAVQRLGGTLKRAHPVDAGRGHGFLSNQREGMDAFTRIPADAPIIVAEAVWQYSHHVLPGLIHHKGPILTVANWSGQWPGLVGMLNLNGSLTKAGVSYSTLWSLDFTDDYFNAGLKAWMDGGTVVHDQSHVTALSKISIPGRLEKIAADIAADMLARKRIMGVFDEGCMGMFNAIVPDHLLNPLGIFKERLSQSALYHETQQIPDAFADEALAWLEGKGMTFAFGSAEKGELTRAQVHTQLKMYAAAARIADRFSCDAVGIQYQQGLKDLLPASDLAEGLLNNDDRPKSRTRRGSRSARARPSPISTKWTNAPASTGCSPTRCIARSASRRRTPCTTSGGATPTPPASRTGSSGFSRSPAPRRRLTMSAAMPARTGTASRPCTSRSAAAPSPGSPGRAWSCGRASTWRRAGCSSTSALPTRLNSTRPRPVGGSTAPPGNGRSCMGGCAASPRPR